MDLKYEYFLIIPHFSKSELRVLLTQQADEKWGLPYFTLAERPPFEPPVVNAKVKELVGLETNILWAMYGKLDLVNKLRIRAFLMENHNAQEPTVGRWVDRAELQNIQPAFFEEVEKWFDEQAGIRQVPAGRMPWATVGWLGQVEEWIKTGLAAHNITMVGAVEQLKTWTLSCLLRVETTDKAVYFKATPKMFEHEAKLSLLLSQYYPKHVPKILASDIERNWILMRDFGGTVLNKSTDIEQWENAVNFYGWLQADAAKHAEALLAAGCHDYRLEGLPNQLEKMLVEVKTALPPDMTEPEIEFLQEALPQIRELCEYLATFEIPATIDHGDFHAENIALVLQDDGEYNHVVYDWSNIGVSHPFVSLLPLMVWSSKISSLSWRRSLRDAYLENWMDIVSHRNLLEAYKASSKIAMVVQALNYHWIVSNLEPESKWEWRNHLGYFLKMLYSHLNR